MSNKRFNNHFQITVDEKAIKELDEKYNKDVALKAVKVVNRYTTKVAGQAKRIIDKAGYRDTGALINSIKPSLINYQYKVSGIVSTNLKYARAIHDGAKNVGNTIQPFFVPFKKAPSLYQWALRNGVIETIDGVDRLVSTGQVVYPDKGGLMVRIIPTKFFEDPFEENKDAFIKDMENILKEV